MFRTLKSWAGRMLLSSTLLAAAGAVRADLTPPTIVPGHDSSEEAVESIQAPAALAQPSGASPALQVRELPPVNEQDKGSSFTDGAFGLPAAPPNALELEKLALARAAVEASRQAGTLFAVEPEEDPPAPSIEEIEAAKMELLRSVQPVVLPPDPVTAVGIEVPPVQVVGPAVPSQEEQAKLASNPSPYAPAPAAEAGPAPATPAAVEVDLDSPPATTQDKQIETGKETH